MTAKQTQALNSIEKNFLILKPYSHKSISCSIETKKDYFLLREKWIGEVINKIKIQNVKGKKERDSVQKVDHILQNDKFQWL